MSSFIDSTQLLKEEVGHGTIILGSLAVPAEFLFHGYYQKVFRSTSSNMSVENL